MADRYYPARDESANIYELQEFLRYISEHTKGIPNVVPDGIYGPETQETVMAFQSKFGLPRTGEADLDTWTMVVEVYDDLIKRHRLPKKISGYPLEILHLKEGDDFEEIYLLQIMLRRISKLFKNITMPEITGVYDDKTSKAVEEFSRLYGKNSNGKVDRELWSILTDTYNSFTHNG